MSFKKKGLRILRNYLYRRYQKAGKQFRKVNRSFLRNISGSSNPIKEASAITSRRKNEHWEKVQPVWVLSTGRTGTHTLTELLKLSPLLDTWHEPSPELFGFSYDYYSNRLKPDEALRTLQYLRDEWVFRSVRDGFIYIETNNRLAYIADLLLKAYPKSKFIYLHRNPYSFIRSGMRRRYYHGHLRDPDRITPNNDDRFAPKWPSMTNIEKVAWNWQAVNRRCLDFMNQLSDDRGMQFSSETFFATKQDLTTTLFNFVGSTEYHPPSSDINRVMGQKHNAQKKGSFAKATEWNRDQLEKVNAIIAPVAQSLSYQLQESREK